MSAKILKPDYPTMYFLTYQLPDGDEQVYESSWIDLDSAMSEALEFLGDDDVRDASIRGTNGHIYVIRTRQEWDRIR